ncbi:MAG TPA: radical SAM protein, partial [Alphaproteobacteria bacterium]
MAHDGTSAPALAARPRKFADPDWTAKGEPRAQVALTALHTLWFNTG